MQKNVLKFINERQVTFLWYNCPDTYRSKGYGIIQAKEWFDPDQLQFKNVFINDEDFVVCQFWNYNDGRQDHFEALETIAICRDINDALELFIGRVKTSMRDCNDELPSFKIS